MPFGTSSTRSSVCSRVQRAEMRRAPSSSHCSRAHAESCEPSFRTRRARRRAARPPAAGHVCLGGARADAGPQRPGLRRRLLLAPLVCPLPSSRRQLPEQIAVAPGLAEQESVPFCGGGSAFSAPALQRRCLAAYRYDARLRDLLEPLSERAGSGCGTPAVAGSNETRSTAAGGEATCLFWLASLQHGTPVSECFTPFATTTLKSVLACLASGLSEVR
jgi:hypothetical protein